MDVLVFVLSVFVVFLVIAMWLGVVRRSELGNSYDNRKSLRVAISMCILSLLMVILLLLNTPIIVTWVVVIVVAIALTPTYRKIARKMEGIEQK